MLTSGTLNHWSDITRSKPVEVDRDGLRFHDGIILLFSAVPKFAKDLVRNFARAIYDCLHELPDFDRLPVLKSHFKYRSDTALTDPAFFSVPGDSNPGRRLLTHMMGLCRQSNNSMSLDQTKLKDWLTKKGNNVSLRMAQSLLCLGGGLARASEVVQALYKPDQQNGIGSLLRTLIPMADGVLSYHLTANKSYSVETIFGGVTRYLPPAISTLFAIYCAYIRPWHEVCSLLAHLKPEVLASQPVDQLAKLLSQSNEKERAEKLGADDSIRWRQVQMSLLLANGKRMTSDYLRNHTSADFSAAASMALKESQSHDNRSCVTLRHWRQMSARILHHRVLPSSRVRASDILRTEPNASLGLLSLDPAFSFMIADQLLAPYIRQFGHSPETHKQAYDGVSSLVNVAPGSSSTHADRDITGGYAVSKLIHEFSEIHEPLLKYWEMMRNSVHCVPPQPLSDSAPMETMSQISKCTRFVVSDLTDCYRSV